MAENILVKIGNAEVIEEQGTLGIRVHTEIGDISAYACPEDNYNGIYTLFNPLDDEGNSLEEIDITSAMFNNEPNGIAVYNWCDPYSENWTDKNIIRREEMVDALRN